MHPSVACREIRVVMTFAPQQSPNAFPQPMASGFTPRARPPAHYKHSGRAPIAGVLAGLAAGLSAGVVLAYVYAYALAYIPVVGYVTFILSAAYGGAAGAIPAFVMRRTNVRNTALTVAIGTIVTLASFYVSWAAWVSAVLARANIETSSIDLVTSPSALWEVIGRINEVGAWTLRGATPTGTILWVFWSLELLLIVGVGVIAAAAVVGREPFCESCGTWARAFDRVHSLPDVDKNELRTRVEGRDWGWLLAGAAAPRSGNVWHEVGLHVCEKCGTTNTVSVEQVVRSVNAKGQASDSRTFVVDHLMIDAEEVNMLRGANAVAPQWPATRSA